MFDDEDDDLVALRRAALASIQVKRKAPEDLSDLRNAALNTRKQFDNEEGTFVFQKIEPPKVSNLISVSLHQSVEEDRKNNTQVRDRFNRDRSGSDSSNYDSDKSRSYDSSASSCSSSSYSESESSVESKKGISPEKPKIIEKKKADDDDILNAIEEFLDEENESEEKTKTEEKIDVKKKKRKKEKKKKVKILKANTKDKTTFANSENSNNNVKKVAKIKKKVSQNVTKKEVMKSNNKEVSKNLNLQKERHTPPKRAKESRFSLEKPSQRSKEDDLNSVHSSDLSFIEDLSDQERNLSRSSSPVAKKFQSKVNGSSNIEQNKFQSTKKPPHLRLGTKINLNPDKTPITVDLRNKLKTKGLHNKSKQQKNDVTNELKSETHSKDQLSQGIKVNITKKIYVKPGFVAGNADVLEFQKQKKTIKLKKETPSWKNEDTSKIIITRGVSDEGFTPISVRLKNSLDREASINEEEEVKPAKIKRGRRSVVQFSRGISATEKKEKIQDLMKKEAEKRKDDLSYSDMSDLDFEDFEIADVVGNLEEEKEETKEPLEDVMPDSPSEDTSTQVLKNDTRRFVRKSSASSESDQDQLDLNSSAEENKRSTVYTLTTRRSSRKNRPRDGVVELSNRRRRSSSVDYDIENENRHEIKKIEQKSRPLSVISSHISMPRNNSDVISRDDASRPDGVRRRKVGITTRRRDRTPPRNSRSSYKRDISSIKSRLGSSIPLITRELSKSPPRRKKRRSDDSPPRRGLKEEEVDARIRRINQQNAAILKRRREIEQEERSFR